MKNEHLSTTEFKRCPICGAPNPSFYIEDPVNHRYLGCETCLIVREEGVTR